MNTREQPASEVRSVIADELVASGTKFNSLIACDNINVNWHIVDSMNRPILACWSGRDAVVHDVFTEELVVTYHISGKVQVRIQDATGASTHMINTKSLGVMSPGRHDWLLSGDFEFLHIYLWPETDKDKARRVDQGISVGFKDTWLKSICEAFVAFGPNRPARLKEFYDACRPFIMDHIFDNYLRGGALAAVPSRVQQGGLSGARLTTVLDYFSENYKSPIKVEDLASLVECSSSHFFRAFKEAMGCSPYSYIIKLRVQEAKHLLQGSELTVGEIAKLSGFTSVSSFGSIFKSLNGCTPLEYRRSQLR